MELGTTDLNAEGFIRRGVICSSNLYYIDLNMGHLGNIFVQWQNKKTISEMQSDENLPRDNIEEKIGKINSVKESVSHNIFTNTTVVGMRISDQYPVVIFDGIHRAIGIYRAFISNPEIKNRVCLKLLLFEGEKFGQLEDYTLSARY